MQDQDDKLGKLLREDAPPQRDALFRLSVLERRERRRLQRRSISLIATAGLLAVILAAGFSMGADLVLTGFVALLAAAVVAACALSVPGVIELAQRLQSSRRSIERN